MKIKEQTRKLAHVALKYGKVKLTWFEEIFEEYENSSLQLQVTEN
ncbi:hypothetical protein [Streptococcus pneumoniae]|nr:hypothetical protein [Streptococcus pneumoniae]